MISELSGVIIKFGGIFAAGFLVAWWAQGIRIEHMATEHETERLMAAASARSQEVVWAVKIEEAKNEGSKREKALRIELLSLADHTVRLRDTLEQLSIRLPERTADANRQAAATCYSVLGDMAAQAGELAAAADGHADDAQTLMAAWPTN